MQHPILRAAAAATVLATAAPIALADEGPANQLPARSVDVHLVVKPSEVARWRSPNIGRVDRVSLSIPGKRGLSSYAVEPNTNNCVAYSYGSGLAIRITDCRKGRRVPYVRVRAVSAALKPLVVRLRLN